VREFLVERKAKNSCALEANWIDRGSKKIIEEAAVTNGHVKIIWY
jgi:hypothetical protein